MLISPEQAASVTRRFASKYIPEPNSGCWLWTGSLNNKGYGELHVVGQGVLLAHRISHELFKGPIEGYFVLHSCDLPCCVNPNHLHLGTQRDNMREAADRGRGNRGRQFPSLRKLSDMDVSAIRADKRPGAQIAHDYGITRQYANQIKRGSIR